MGDKKSELKKLGWWVFGVVAVLVFLTVARLVVDAFLKTGQGIPNGIDKSAALKALKEALANNFLLRKRLSTEVDGKRRLTDKYAKELDSFFSRYSPR